MTINLTFNSRLNLRLDMPLFNILHNGVKNTKIVIRKSCKNHVKKRKSQ